MHTKKFLTWILIASAFLAISCGCSGAGKQLAGSWKGTMAAPAGKENDPGVKMTQSLVGNITLDLAPDSSFKMSMVFPLEGTWTVADNKISLTVTKAMGMTLEELKKKNPASGNGLDKPMVLDVSADSKTLTAENPAGTPNSGALTFARA